MTGMNILTRSLDGWRRKPQKQQPVAKNRPKEGCENYKLDIVHKGSIAFARGVDEIRENYVILCRRVPRHHSISKMEL